MEDEKLVPFPALDLQGVKCFTDPAGEILGVEVRAGGQVFRFQMRYHAISDIVRMFEAEAGKLADNRARAGRALAEQHPAGNA